MGLINCQKIPIELISSFISKRNSLERNCCHSRESASVSLMKGCKKGNYCSGFYSKTRSLNCQARGPTLGPTQGRVKVKVKVRSGLTLTLTLTPTPTQKWDLSYTLKLVFTTTTHHTISKGVIERRVLNKSCLYHHNGPQNDPG